MTGIGVGVLESLGEPEVSMSVPPESRVGSITTRRRQTGLRPLRLWQDYTLRNLPCQMRLGKKAGVRTPLNPDLEVDSAAKKTKER